MKEPLQERMERVLQTITDRRKMLTLHVEGYAKAGNYEAAAKNSIKLDLILMIELQLKKELEV